MTRTSLALVAGAALITLGVSLVAQEAPKPAAGLSLGSVTLGKKVLADGQPLAAGTYQVRLTADEPRPAVGQTPSSERYVEFLRAGKVVGRELATVFSNAEVAAMERKWARPAANSTKVELLKGGDYIRVWINRGGNNFLIHLPPA